MEEFLTKLILTLNEVEVKGEDNLMKMIVCISEAKHELSKIQAENATGEDGDTIDGE